MCSFYLLHYVLHCIVYYLGCDHRFMVHPMKLDQHNIYLDIIKLSFSFFVYWLHQHHKWRASTTYCSLDFVITCSPLYVSDLFFYIYICVKWLLSTVPCPDSVKALLSHWKCLLKQSVYYLYEFIFSLHCIDLAHLLLFLSVNLDGHILSTNNDTSPVFFKWTWKNINFQTIFISCYKWFYIIGLLCLPLFCFEFI